MMISGRICGGGKVVRVSGWTDSSDSSGDGNVMRFSCRICYSDFSGGCDEGVNAVPGVSSQLKGCDELDGR